MGLGDSIMVTGIAREVRKKYPNTQIVVGDKNIGLVHYSTMFKNNPNILKESEVIKDKKKIWIENIPGKRPYILHATKHRFFWNKDHIPFKGELYFDNNEKIFAEDCIKKVMQKADTNKKNKKIVFIEPSRSIKEYKIKNVYDGEKNRIWKIDRWQAFINYFKDRFIFIQPTYEGFQSLEHVTQFPSDFRQACSIMSYCDYFVGWEGGFVHAAAALDKKAVVLYGGFVHPSITGYNFHNNIYIDINGSPCGMRDWCEHCDKSRELITVDMVINEFNKIT